MWDLPGIWNQIEDSGIHIKKPQEKKTPSKSAGYYPTWTLTFWRPIDYLHLSQQFSNGGGVGYKLGLTISG